MRRREFIAGLGGAAAWPVVVSGQNLVLPVIGFLNAASDQVYAPHLAVFLKALGEAGFVDGHNVMIEYRWAEDRNERLPGLAADLVQHQVTVIAATSTPAALAAKAATTTIPIIFETAADPVSLGLVGSLNRPGGNVTGVTQSNVEVASKRLELLHDLFPAARLAALLVNPSNPAVAESTTSQTMAAAHLLDVELRVLTASTEGDFESVFTQASQMGVSGLVISGGDPLFASRTGRLGALASQHLLPAVGAGHAFVASGGLLSYGSSILDAYGLAGVYTGRILKGEKPADLPVVQPTKFEFSINLKTARALDLTIPLTLLARADEVIE
jgi:putative tryptophan/tyrosine transport system substrate-binding protein